jgi:hypothetical protein
MRIMILMINWKSCGKKQLYHILRYFLAFPWRDGAKLQKMPLPISTIFPLAYEEIIIIIIIIIINNPR